jgi:hypothetical protein
MHVRSDSGPTRQAGCRPATIVIAAKGLAASRDEPRRRRPRTAGNKPPIAAACTNCCRAARRRWRSWPGPFPGRHRYLKCWRLDHTSVRQRSLPEYHNGTTTFHVAPNVSPGAVADVGRHRSRKPGMRLLAAVPVALTLPPARERMRPVPSLAVLSAVDDTGLFVSSSRSRPRHS